MPNPESTCLIVQPSQDLRGTTGVPGDKSISHRAVMLAALAEGRSTVRGWLAAGDTEATLRSVQALGVRVERPAPDEIHVHGQGSLRAAAEPLDFANAGTGIRLMTGIMAGQPFASVLDGTPQLRRRPMKRIITPLTQMGADISGVEGRAPLRIQPAALRGIRYEMPVASAQVKSAVLLAGLFAKGETTVVEPGPTRDHSECMLRAAGVDVQAENGVVTLQPATGLRPLDFRVPGDFSSAAFLLVAATTAAGSELRLTGINLNPTRTGLLDALRMMGADIQVSEVGMEAGEPSGTLTVKQGPLCGIEIGGDMVVRMIDEFPALMVAALCAEGRTTVRDAGELRLKETDRLSVMTQELRRLGASIEEREGGFVIEGPQALQGADVDGHDDHRIAMSLTLAGMLAQGQTRLHDAECIADSFPGFEESLRSLGARVVAAQDE
ncbi:MAG: 3-phosphoshikimate 1-carboxyvinyltransferase [Anaerolineaceae bacterium]|nr:3-phosphoshikimate 1-carboxyvinyltransferase [Anaerolineaceae bacterium]